MKLEFYSVFIAALEKVFMLKIAPAMQASETDLYFLMFSDGCDSNPSNH